MKQRGGRQRLIKQREAILNNEIVSTVTAITEDNRFYN